MTHTLNDLKIMRALPLDLKIEMSLTRIIAWHRNFGGSVYVSYSGGKDSTVLLDLVRKIYPSVKAVFVDTGLEYPEIREQVTNTSNVTWLKPSITFKETLDRYGYPVISKDVSQKIYYAKKGSFWAEQIMKGVNYDGSYSKYRQRYIKYQYLLNAPFNISSSCCDVMKKRPFRKFEKENDTYSFIGTMAEESFIRQQNWLKTGCNAFDSLRPTSKPLSFWTSQDILKYLKQEKIPFASVYGEISNTDKGDFCTTGLDRTGCMFCMFGVHLEKQPNRFQKMKITHPKQYDYCINHLQCGKVLDYIGVEY